VIRTRDPLLRKQVLYPLSYEGKMKWRGGWDSNPRSSFIPDNRLAGGPNQPLWHLPGRDLCEAEGEGFEPPVGFDTHSCFQDSRLRPLGHPSCNRLSERGDFTIAKLSRQCRRRFSNLDATQPASYNVFPRMALIKGPKSAVFLQI
jgi:hypothetical protein